MLRDIIGWANEHWFVAGICAIMLVQGVCEFISWPFRLVNRAIRNSNIRAAGWPPQYLDADGDAIKKDDA